MIDKVRGQLDCKARPDHSKHVVLVAHQLDHFAIETYNSPIMLGHLLEPLSELADVATV